MRFPQKKIFSFFITILSILGYGVVVFATQLPDGTTPPVDGYLAGDSILDPGCAPGTANCFQNMPSGWSLTGNAGTDGGTTNFIGTTDAQDFVIKTNGVQIAKFGQSGNVAMGTDGSGTVYSGLIAFPQATGLGSNAFGFNATSSGAGSVAFAGNGNAAPNDAQGDFSFAQGAGNTAYSFGEFVIGIGASVYSPVGGTTNENDFDRRFVVGNNNENAYTLWKDGSFAYNDDNFQNDTVGEQNMFYFNYGNHDGGGSINSKKAIRFGSALSNEWDIASANVGDKSIALGFGSSQVGHSTPTASGLKSFAFLSGIASGSDSIAAGTFGTEASGDGSIAFGNGTLASGDVSVTFGASTLASGILSTAFGDTTTASGGTSVAFGLSTMASGSSTAAFGSSTFARSYGETALGVQNTDYTPVSSTTFNSADRLFIIGNGNGTVSDAFTILKNGKIGIGYNNFETTSSAALLQIDGDILSSSLTSCVLIETDSNGLFGCGTLPTPPISVGASGNTLYSSGLSGTGQGESITGGNIILGTNAGTSASSASHVNFLGTEAGYQATWSSDTNFFGYQAGYQANNATGANFIGSGAGKSATNAGNANFIGTNAGLGASSAASSNFIGFAAGQTASNAPYSNFIGQSAGTAATNAAISVFVGLNTGNGATNASNSIFIGQNTGASDTVNNTGNASDFSILIGGGNLTGGFSNSIALGQSVTNTATNQFMIGSTIRPINITRINGASSTQCTITTGTGIACTSDERVKTNIADLASNTLENLLRVRTVTYNWLANPASRQQVGFLAQDLEQFFPQLVDTDNEGMKSVYYAQMTPLLVEGIRELNIKIEDILSFPTSANTTFINTIKTWLASETNGILDIFSKKITTEQVCIKRTDGTVRCITGDQLDQLLNSSSSENILIPPPAPESEPPTEPTPTPEPDPVPDQTPVPDPTPVPEITE